MVTSNQTDNTSDQATATKPDNSGIKLEEELGVEAERREALMAIFNLAIFILLWGGSSVWGLFTSFHPLIKIGIIVAGFPFWGLITNHLFTKLTGVGLRPGHGR